MIFGTSMNTGLGGRHSLGGNGDRSQVLGRRYQPFSNPFFDQASTYTPGSIKDLFGFCRFYFLTHGIINTVITKASEYPVTDLIIQHRDAGVRRRWEELMNGVLNYRVHQYEINLDLNVYGNAFVSLSFPFTKYLYCESCGKDHNALRSRSSWHYTNHRFRLTCSSCGNTGFAKSQDQYSKNASEIGLVRWNPENVHIFHNESTGRLDYALDVSAVFRSEIMMGRKDLVATTPDIFLEVIKTKRQLVFDPHQVFHLRRPGLSTMSRGWGIPMLMPVLKDAFYVQVMRKAQEAVLLTHLVPQVFLFPTPATAGADPFSTIDLANWRDHIRRELARQRMDPSYYGILPFPLGHQVIGENGRSLLLMPEIQQANETIIAGMGFPVDLVMGHGTYAGSSVSMRMLENFFLSNVLGHKRLLDWVMKRISAYINLPMAEGRFKPFRMADDLQRQALMLQLHSVGEVSSSTLLSYMDLTVEDESELILGETKIKADALRKRTLMQAEAQGEAQLVMAKNQAQAQAAAQTAAVRESAPKRTPFDALQSLSVGTQATGFPLDAVAAALAQKVRLMPPEQQRVYMEQLNVKAPEISQLLATQGVMPQGQEQPSFEMPEPMTPAVNMNPMPEKLPPRRAGAV